MGDYIIFRVQNLKKEKGLLLLHPEIGNYSSMKHPSFAFKEGDKLDFSCPICSHALDSDIEENLIHVVMIDKDQKENDIYFSRIAGEKSTYQVMGRTVMATGAHSSRYTYFKLSDKFKRFLKI